MCVREGGWMGECGWIKEGGWMGEYGWINGWK